MNKKLNDAKSHHINDIDPYGGRQTIPQPLFTEKDSETAWQDFLVTEAQMDEVHAKAQLDALAMTMGEMANRHRPFKLSKKILIAEDNKDACGCFPFTSSVCNRK